MCISMRERTQFYTETNMEEDCVSVVVFIHCPLTLFITPALR